MLRLPNCLASLILVLVAASFAHSADEWPQFRGPGGQGHADATGLPLTWSESKNVTWKTAIPGRGHSSPVISGNQIWLLTAKIEKLSPEEVKARLAKLKNSNGLSVGGRVSLIAVCVDRKNGKVTRQIPLLTTEEPEPIHTLNSYASPTPVIEGNKLYCHFGTYGTVCLNTDTDKVEWKQTNLRVNHQNGPGSSPVVWRDLVIVHLDGIDRQFVAALDKRSGKVVWKTARSGKMNARPEFQKAYCTPLIVENDKRVQLISPGADWVYSYDPASGEELWRAHYGQLGFSTVPRPVIGDGMVFICTSYLKSRLLAVRYDGSGEVTKTHVAWHSDRQAPKKPSLLFVNGLIYAVSDGGVATCFDVRSGEQKWVHRLGGQYSSSPLYADGRIYICSQDGQTTVIKPGSKYTELASNKLDGGFMASPAVAGKAMFLRTEGHLYRIEK
ncbi:MAG: PQQ-binding-like beta-propeller repeat protein [Planctomycetaceae bacterium]|nr:PQQ-binding-like beta-propeller repeat protein [Planctomycetaceae bacterium]MBT6156757.1 PQQ-binding-like beta-propeller repeat protein [Planctomycetaceae bacterium]MBT6487712.1 PQQ-binding-like beta-propeller repeat protein [Planctomycetaceae bacterium]MBT6494195.1 PQQ-binding-like beta-propeller repeat protein [Planctomycetaceae bacterium]